ncbi:hypothetical protein [Salinibacterium sp. SWN1162]|uniref:hypothetical protein n=1 Tax=Salinibacterium sp. SWN1162 TaxID=2792053 RepID=UPI0018CDD9E8|nr:hypothetical protein [Salinibacterium sp. SWN1162]MBH0009983.1 hypothetical protein [Salinibacterium sp. SWN1162]
MNEQMPSTPIADRWGMVVDRQPIESNPENYAVVKPDLLVPLEVRGFVTWAAHPEVKFEARLRWGKKFSYILEFVSITSSEGISTSDMHSYSIPKLIAGMATGTVLLPLPGGEEESYVHLEQLLGLADLEAMRERIHEEGPVTNSLLWVGRLYAYGRAVGENPNVLVMSVLDLPQRTATRWISRARTEGLLD